MSKRLAMAPMIACSTEAMPLTMAIRQLPMVRKMDSICLKSCQQLDFLKLGGVDDLRMIRRHPL
jgi:hypothetical protein